jgi:hypothetical protein
MPLKMRPTGLGRGVYKDIPNWAPAPPRCAGSGRCMFPASQGACAFEPSGNAGRAKAEFEASWKAVESVGGNGGGWLTSRE